MDYLQLEGKTAIVSGGAGEIGSTVMRRLVAAGCKVCICDIADAKGRALTDEFTAAGQVRYFHCDVTLPQQVKDAVQAAIDAFGRVDILVNCAAIGENAIQFEKITPSQWQRMLDVNLKGTYTFMVETVPHMIRNRYGKVVNLSSGMAVVGQPGQVHYAAASGGVLGITQSVAKEVARHGLTVNAIAVDITESRFARENGFMECGSGDIPAGRYGTSNDVANMVLYLVSDASAYVCGQVMAPNGARRTPV